MLRIRSIKEISDISKMLSLLPKEIKDRYGYEFKADKFSTYKDSFISFKTKSFSCDIYVHTIEKIQKFSDFYTIDFKGGGYLLLSAWTYDNIFLKMT